MTHRTETLDTMLTACSGNSSPLEWRLGCAVARRCALTFLAVATLALRAQAASPAAEASARLLEQAEPRIKAIYETDEFHMRSFGATWLPDGSGYLKLETPDGASGAEIARYDSASGKRTVAVASEKLLVPGTSDRLRETSGVRLSILTLQARPVWIECCHATTTAYRLPRKPRACGDRHNPPK